MAGQEAPRSRWLIPSHEVLLLWTWVAPHLQRHLREKYGGMKPEQLADSRQRARAALHGQVTGLYKCNVLLYDR